MKAIVLTAGQGKRISSKKNKCLLEINNKPILEYNLDRAASISDISSIVLVVGYKADAITLRYYDEYKGKKLEYVYQNTSFHKGIVEALGLAKRKIGKDDFFLMLGDEMMINPKHRGMAWEFERNRSFGLCGYCFVNTLEEVTRTYTMRFSEGVRIARLVEKPSVDEVYNTCKGTGHCIFSNEILDYIDKVPINPVRKEKDFVDLINLAIADGHRVKAFQIADEYFNINTDEDYLVAKKVFENENQRISRN